MGNTLAKRINSNGLCEEVLLSSLNEGDIILVAEGEEIPTDGIIVEGIAYVNEAAITGESVPVIKSCNGDNINVFRGSIVIRNSLKIRISLKNNKKGLSKVYSLFSKHN